jgi:Flp pilus assembly protein TadG
MHRSPQSPGASGQARRRPAWLRDCSGVAAVEFALIAPAFVLLMLGVMESGRLLWTQASLHYAVEAAARCGAVDTTTCGTSGNIQNYAVAKASGLHLKSSVFTVSTPVCGTQVSASYAFKSVVPNLLPYTLTLTAKSCFPT